ncbi:phosphoribosylanthranilate isomerase [Anoxybacillus flavithermus]|uniref:N-(5'-phosphoribosyl)anthranilate isomerase n=1 Tax=Anoxybacillus flavithermus TaxID=33934 RepID=A0A2G5RQB8_9BACL|nr:MULTISPECIES: phosphoribosylanthranilate isomerase [Anoxybacillus]KFZ41833.1 N-(5'-phosphoribosyl)anthranilate isomerase [Anoxybacillus sp. KU2-6(11)]PIC04882.1 phosphoribosylanthranilate isomerase [Anoxybacillus flavithermus]
MTVLKYCGNRSLQDVQLIAKSKADYIGFVFAESKRKVEPKNVKRWLSVVQLETKQIVGVFVHPTIHSVASVLEHVPLSIIQCHGMETVQTVREIKEAFQLPVWKVIHHIPEAWSYMRIWEGVADGFVIDSGRKGAWGGTGVSFDWTTVPCYMEEAKRQGVPCFIAGGITPDNVEQLLAYEPFGIDISSGIEEDEQKSEQKIKQIEQKVMKC